MAICSTTKIVVGSTTLLNFGDVMDSEASVDYSQENQLVPLIRGRWKFNEGRQGGQVALRWSRYYFFDPETSSLGSEEEALDALRIFQQLHVVPGVSWPSPLPADFAANAISIPDGTNTVAITFENNYGAPIQVDYSEGVITNVSVTIPQPLRALVFYDMMCTGGSA